MKLSINDELLHKVWGSADEFWFSPKNYSVMAVQDLQLFDRPDGISQSEYYVKSGLIPFVYVTSEESMRSFIDKSGNKKLITALSKVKSDEFTETFWKYYNAYKELSGYDEYESKFVVDKIVEWCKENNIEYTVDVK